MIANLQPNIAVPAPPVAFSHHYDDRERTIRPAGVALGIAMGKEEERANERRRQEAARIILDNEKRAKHKRTDEWLIDQEALRQAAIRVGLEKPDKG
ncbi:MAG: hypothetical protein ABI843_09060 [Dokdonella sp.]